MLKRSSIGLLAILPLNIFGQNAATQYANLTVTINSDTAKSVTVTASQNTQYTTYQDDLAYILIPTVTKTLTAAQIAASQKIDLTFEIQVRPVQTARENFQLQAASLIQRFNIVGFLSPFYFKSQFYPLQVGAAAANTLYVYSSILHANKAVKLWYQGQTVIGNSSTPQTTIAFLLGNSYTNYNILENATGTTATQSVQYTLSIPKAAIDYLASQIAGTYFFQIYLTLTSYQVPVNSTTVNFLNNTKLFLNTLYQQTFSYNAPVPAQVLANRAFLLNELQEVDAAIASLS
jgi:hypothetical protein